MQQSRARRRRLHRPKPAKRRQVPQDGGPGQPLQALRREYRHTFITLSNLPFVFFSPLSLCPSIRLPSCLSSLLFLLWFGETKALNKKEHRDSESPEPEEPFSLTPRTEEKYKKIDEEFDKMMQNYRLSVSTAPPLPPPPQTPPPLCNPPHAGFLLPEVFLAADGGLTTHRALAFTIRPPPSPPQPTCFDFPHFISCQQSHTPPPGTPPTTHQ